jgi:ADP-dependent phosphofructokinase/glucokinase
LEENRAWNEARKGVQGMSSIEQRQIWHQRLQQAVRGRLEGTVLSAFNANVDVVVHLDNTSLQRMLADNPDLDWEQIDNIDVTDLPAVRTREEFVAVLIDRLGQGKSVLLVGESTELSMWFEEHFPKRYDKLGGQAGIMATQLASLAAKSVLYSPILSRRQAEVLHPGVLFPVVDRESVRLESAKQAARDTDPTRSPWVFEYGKDETYSFGHRRITTPRANRIIVVPRDKGLGMNFTPEFSPHLAEFGRHIDVGMVAGYHLGGPDPDDREIMRRYFHESLEALRTIRQANPRLKLHLEYVPMKEKNMEKEMLLTMSQGIDSFGINEVEIGQVLELMGETDLAREIAENERACVLYQGGLKLLRHFGIERIHIHNLGYYVLVLKKPYFCTPQKVRQACLFGSSVNAHRALTGECASSKDVFAIGQIPLSKEGLKQLDDCAAELADEYPGAAEQIRSSGCAEFDDHYLVVVPTHVIPNPVVTVGMGDTISSSVYAMEVIGHLAQADDVTQ